MERCPNPSPRKRIAARASLIILGIAACLLTLEAGLRSAGWIWVKAQEYRNRRALEGGAEYRIVCFGESTTVWGGSESWPSQLGRILNDRYRGKRFAVINKGRHGIQTSGVLAMLEESLRLYRPHMVIVMMGINDGDNTIRFIDSPKTKARLFTGDFRVVKTVALLGERLSDAFSRLGLRKAGFKRFKSCIKEGYRLRDEGRLQEAEHLFQEALRIRRDITLPYIGLGYVYQDQGKFSQAEEAFRKTIQLDVRCKEAYAQLGECLVKQQRYGQAHEILQEALRQNPDDLGAYYSLFLCLREQGFGYDELEQLLKHALEKTPESGNGWSYVELGKLNLDQKRYSEAEAFLRKAINHDLRVKPRQSRRAIIELGNCYLSQGKYGQMQELVSLVEQSKIADDRLYAFLAIDRLRAGDHEGAEGYFRQAEEFRSQYYSAPTRDNYRRFREIVKSRGIRLVCVQYPMRSTVPLKKLFDSAEGIVFVDNERVFKDALRQGRYEEYFQDNFAGDFGHGTPKGNRLLAEHIADVLQAEVFQGLLEVE